MNFLISCGGFTDIPDVLPNLISLVINGIKIVVPIMLIIFGMLDLGKAVAAGKEDDIKKGQTTFMKRAIAAITVFLIVAIVQLIFSLLAQQTGNSSDKNITGCISCFVNGASSCK